jgi:hypothetical protein
MACLEDRIDAAREIDRRFSHSRRANLEAGDAGQTSLLEFADFGRTIGGAQVHRAHQRHGYEVDGEFEVALDAGSLPM